MKNCPYCGEEIQDAAKKCKYCGEWLQIECPECHEWVNKNLSICTNCGNTLENNQYVNDSYANKQLVKKQSTSEKSEDDVLIKIIAVVLVGVIACVICYCIYCFVSKAQEKSRIEQEQNKKEAQVKEKKELLEYEKALQNSIIVHSAVVSVPDISGNVSTSFDVENVSTKTIKYITIMGFYINSFGEQTNDNNSNKKDYTWRLVGPFNPNERQNVTYKNLICNNTVRNLVFSEIKVEYTDGSWIMIKGQENLKKICKW